MQTHYIPGSLLLFLSILFHSFDTVSANELKQIRLNYEQLFISSENSNNPLVEILSQIPPETEMSDQVVVELHQRYPLTKEQIVLYLETVKADGSWPDINYEDRKRSGWEPKVHAERVAEMVKYYRKQGKNGELATELVPAIHKTMQFWFREKPECLNWWYNQIGVPKAFAPAFLLFEDEMTPEEKKGAIEVMEHARFGMTGQNKVWLAGNVMVRALLQNDIPLVKAARDTIVSEIRLGAVEGIKSDWSFHQHGPMQQFGNYGLAYLMEMSFYSALFANTPFEINAEQQKIINNLLLEGYRWVVWSGYLETNSLNRQLYHNVQRHKGLSVGFAAQRLINNSDEEDGIRLKNFLDDNFAPGKKGSSFTGHKHFWNSDHTIHRASQWMGSVRMASDRVLGTELVNEDNLRGFYMADGALYTFCEGDEYENVFPFWDWRKIPGITSYETNNPIPTEYRHRSQNKSSFVGGVTDGKTGMTAMILDRDGVHAYKSWVMTDNFIVCLGSHIYTDSCLSLTTSIDQRLKRGTLYSYTGQEWKTVEGKESTEQIGQRYFHDKTGYILLQADNCTVISEKRSGQWHDFMGMYTPVTVQDEMISLYISHPEQIADYQYMILPATDKDNVATFDTSEIKILQNDEHAHAIKIGNTWYITTYQPVKITLDRKKEIHFTIPGIYMLKETKGSYEVIGTDPTGVHKELTIEKDETRIKIL